MIKNELKGLPLRMHKEESLDGYLFITFLSLIVRISLLNKMRETGLLRQFSVEKLFLTLRKLRLVQYEKQAYLTEITKEQRQIFERLNIVVPKN